jgi:D-alanine-D-alanine ligase
LQKELILKQAKLERIRRVTKADQRKLYIGIAGNLFDEREAKTAVESELASVGLVIEKVLRERGYKTTFFNFNKMPGVIQELKDANVDLVFNVCERINNSSLLEPHAASLLDILQIPYTGSNPFTLGLCMDKIRVKKLLAHHNIPTPNWDYVYSVDDEVSEDLTFPLIVKPAMSDNSIGVTNDSVVINKEQLAIQIKKILTEYHVPALIEEYIAGDEYDVSILGSETDNLKVLPLSRSVFSNLPKNYWHIYSYEAKWGLDTTFKKHVEVQRPPKKISSKLQSLISEIALDTYNILDCHDYGRVEIRVDEHNNPYVLELNPNPAINTLDCLPSVASLVGMDYGDFLEEIISLAINRYKFQPPYHHLQQQTVV